MDCWWSLFIVVNRGLFAPLKCRFPPFCCYSAPSITKKAQSLHFSFTWVEIINEPFIKNAPREQPGNFTTHFIFCLITAPWGEPTQTNTWGVSLGRIRGSPRATEPALDPRAATPAGKGATGNSSIQTSALMLTGSIFFVFLFWIYPAGNTTDWLWSTLKSLVHLEVGFWMTAVCLLPFALQQTEGASVQRR